MKSNFERLEFAVRFCQQDLRNLLPSKLIEIHENLLNFVGLELRPRGIKDDENVIIFVPEQWPDQWLPTKDIIAHEIVAVVSAHTNFVVYSESFHALPS
ncbi:hypothetical protein L0244_00135, partial [bacterium]|nr:hypothetical protein [bacterium]